MSPLPAPAKVGTKKAEKPSCSLLPCAFLYPSMTLTAPCEVTLESSGSRGTALWKTTSPLPSRTVTVGA